MKILNIFEIGLDYTISVLQNMNKLWPFFSFFPELIMLIVISGMILLGRKGRFPLPTWVGVYLSFLFMNAHLEINGAGFLFQRTDLVQTACIFLTFFAILIAFVIRDKYEIRILYLLLIVFLNTLICAANLMSFFICLEAVSFTVFMLSVCGSKTVVKTESTTKYFIVTAISSSVMLLAMGLLFNLIGSLSYSSIILYYLLTKKTIYTMFPLILLFCSFLLKIGLYPGHGWVADVSEGVSYSTFLLINILVKFALLIFIKLVFLKIFPITILLIYIGILSYVVGIFMTLMQRKLIRFLAFGSISNIGFVFSLFALSDLGIFSLTYLVIYFISLYKIIMLMESTLFNLDSIVYITDLSQLLDLDVKAYFAFNILEIGGFPPYNIFILKIIFIFFLIKNNFFSVALLFLILSVVSTFYYIRLIKNLFYDLNSPFAILMDSIEYYLLILSEYAVVVWVTGGFPAFISLLCWLVKIIYFWDWILLDWLLKIL